MSSRGGDHAVLSQESMIEFLRVLAKTGKVTVAADTVGISRQRVQEWRNRSKRDRKDSRYLISDPLGDDPDIAFCDAWEIAKTDSIDLVRDEAMTLATGYEEPIVFQGKLAYAQDTSQDFKVDALTGMVYWPPKLDPLTGEPQVLTIRKVSERAVFEILKARDPDFKPKTDIDVTSGGKPIAVPERVVDMATFLAEFGRKVGE